MPVLSENHGIKLNGFAAAREPFSLPSANAIGRANHGRFCKTKNKPYEIVLTAVLTGAAL